MEDKIYFSKMMIAVRRDLKMRKGKIAAQASHGAVDVALRALKKENRLGTLEITDEGIFCPLNGEAETPLTWWFNHGTAKICVYVDSEEELLALNERARSAGLLTALIRDAGMTEFHGNPTYTCLAIEPALPETVDPITGDLPLY